MADDPAQTPSASGGCLSGNFRQFLRVQNTCPGGAREAPFTKPLSISVRPPAQVCTDTQRIHFLSLFIIGLGDVRGHPLCLPLSQLLCPGAWLMCGPCSDFSDDCLGPRAPLCGVDQLAPRRAASCHWPLAAPTCLYSLPIPPPALVWPCIVLKFWLMTHTMTASASPINLCLVTALCGQNAGCNSMAYRWVASFKTRAWEIDARYSN